MTTEKKSDVLVIGGGPAGATSATLLARGNRHVVLLEKERFPRYCVGESMIPYCYFPLERLGLIPKLRDSHFTKKFSVQFVSTDGRVAQPFYFDEHFDHDAAMTWQVVRSEFDQILMDNARESGVEIVEGVRARNFLEESGRISGLKAIDEEGVESRFEAPLTIDASGRDALSLRRFGWRQRDTRLEKVAIWTYYRGALRDSGRDEGATTIAYLPEKGWFWYIPLPGDLVSVGIVADKSYLYDKTRDPDSIFKQEVEKNPWVEEHLAPGFRDGPYRRTGDYSYRSKHCAADGLVLTGDAFAFLDPVFSSGILLALLGGELAAEAAEKALADNDFSAGQFVPYGKKVCAAIEAMRRLVYAFYDKEFSFRQLLERHPDLKRDVTDGLMGNLFKDFTKLFEAIGEFARMPGNLSHGLPLLK